MHQKQNLKTADVRARIALSQQRINRPRRHSAIRRFAGFGIVR